MSRWIDADAFLKEYCEPYPHIYKAMSRAMADAPSIDIVRCKECKKCYKDTDALTKQTVFICQKHKYEFDWEKVEADDYCSYGERRER